MVLKRVGPLSFAKVAGVLYAIMGLLFGCLMSLIAMVGGALAPSANVPGLFPGMLFGVGAVVILPVLYGVFGFVFTLIGAGLYNLVAGWVGGFELDLQ
jgi:hypothetical protein